MEELEQIIGKENIKYNESMASHTSFKVGGPAEIYATINNVETLIKAIKYAKEHDLNVTIIGNGTNVLVKDEGIKGLVIRYVSEDYEISFDENLDDAVFTVSAGMLNAKAANILLEEGYSGFEVLAGIPGTIGGAVYMNAGAFGWEVKNNLYDVDVLLLEDMNVYTLLAEKCDLGYRSSIFQNENCIILSASFKVKKESKDVIKNNMEEYREKRALLNQPKLPNAGSTFKRGTDFVTAKLIDDAGLKGKTIGGAQVSLDHAGFIVNTGDATAKDILDLVDLVKKEIKEKFDKDIELEVRILE